MNATQRFLLWLIIFLLWLPLAVFADNAFHDLFSSAEGLLATLARLWSEIGLLEVAIISKPSVNHAHCGDSLGGYGQPQGKAGVFLPKTPERRW